MTLRAFIKEHKQAIDAHIHKVCPNVQKLTLKERELWMQNDETLYTWWQREKKEASDAKA